MEQPKENIKYYSVQAQKEEEEEDTLSFSDLPIGNNDHNSADYLQQTNPHQIDQLFEFFTGFTFDNKDEDAKQNEYEKRDYFATIKPSSFHEPVSKNKSNSTRFSNPTLDFYRSRSSLSGRAADYHAQRVNISSLTSMSTKSRRRMFMFGPVKFKPEMELSEIKQRQSRQPNRTFLPEGWSEGMVVNGGAGGEGKKSGSYWGVLRKWKGRSSIGNAVSRSFGCIPSADMKKLESVG